ncbi:MAG: hypothetical protein JXI43_08975 [Tissierellales bacterium]|nr:hypothetical protein [Tissierellales bacterium]
MYQTMLEQFIVLSIFLLVGYGIRVFFKPIQKLFLPSSLLGGLIGLILLPNGTGLIPMSEEWMKDFGSIPGVLITVVVTASILGIKFPKIKELAGGIGRQFMHLNIMFFSQIGLGLLVGSIFLNSTYPTFGFELVGGFTGGHGTAGLIGSSLKNLELDWWLSSQGVTITLATIGIIGGILIGIVMIQYAARKGQIKFVGGMDNLPQEIIKGYSLNTDAKSIGKTIQHPSSLEPFVFILSLVLVSVGLAFQVRKLFVGTIIFNVAAWAWGIIIMAIIWLIMTKLKLDWLIDTQVKARIMGTVVDYLVVAAIISLPVRAVAGYIIPVIALALVGMISMIFITLYLGQKMLPKEDWFERSIINFGNCTGVGATGVLLLRLVDPDFETNALSNWSLAFALCSLYIWFIFAFLPLMMLEYGLFAVGLGATVLTVILVIACKFIPGFWNK